MCCGSLYHRERPPEILSRPSPSEPLPALRIVPKDGRHLLLAWQSRRRDRQTGTQLLEEFIELGGHSLLAIKIDACLKGSAT
jgi:hypothetical protein